MPQITAKSWEYSIDFYFVYFFCLWRRHLIQNIFFFRAACVSLKTGHLRLLNIQGIMSCWWACLTVSHRRSLSNILKWPLFSLVCITHNFLLLRFSCLIYTSTKSTSFTVSSVPCLHFKVLSSFCHNLSVKIATTYLCYVFYFMWNLQNAFHTLYYQSFMILSLVL